MCNKATYLHLHLHLLLYSYSKCYHQQALEEITSLSEQRDHLVKARDKLRRKRAYYIEMTSQLSGTAGFLHVHVFPLHVFFLYQFRTEIIWICFYDSFKVLICWVCCGSGYMYTFNTIPLIQISKNNIQYKKNTVIFFRKGLNIYKRLVS